MKKELSNGFTITDNRSIGCGVQIENNKSMTIGCLSYSHKLGVYINVYGRWLESHEFARYVNELKKLNKVLTEANKFLKENEK
jgi:hypothetical protein